LEKVLPTIGLEQKQSVFQYWQTKDSKTQLEAIELSRNQYIKFKKKCLANTIGMHEHPIYLGDLDIWLNTNTINTKKYFFEPIN
jgi:hypothetical protein